MTNVNAWRQQTNFSVRPPASQRDLAEVVAKNKKELKVAVAREELADDLERQHIVDVKQGASKLRKRRRQRKKVKGLRLERGVRRTIKKLRIKT